MIFYLVNSDTEQYSTIKILAVIVILTSIKKTYKNFVIFYLNMIKSFFQKVVEESDQEDSPVKPRKGSRRADKSAESTDDATTAEEEDSPEKPQRKSSRRLDEDDGENARKSSRRNDEKSSKTEEKSRKGSSRKQEEEVESTRKGSRRGAAEPEPTPKRGERSSKRR